MNISGIGNTGIDYTKLTSPQAEQQELQQESEEALLQAAETVQQAAGGNGADSSGSQTAADNQAQSQISSVASASQQLAESLESAAENDSGNATLVSKANSGAELTQSELSQLKELDYSLYAQAVNAQKARAEAREQMQANPSFSTEAASKAIAQAIQDNESDTAVKAIINEYQSFASKYDQVDFSSHY